MEQEKKRKIFIAIAVVVVLAVIAVVIYFLFIKKSAEEPKTGPEKAEFPLSKESQGMLVKRKQAVVSKKISPIIDKMVVGPVIAANNRLRFFSKEDGKFYEADLSGANQRAPYDVTYTNIVDAEWNKDGTAALITTADAQEKKKWFIFDLALDRPRNIEINKRNDDRIISPELSGFELGKYYYQFSDKQTSYGVISSANYNDKDYGSGEYQYKNIIESSVIPLKIDVPQKNIVAFYHPASGLAMSNLYTYNASDKQLKKIISDTYGLSILWGPKGDVFLYSQTDSKGMGLAVFLANDQGQAISDLSFGANKLKTVPEKCAFTALGGRLYCAAYVEDPTEYEIMPDAFYKGTVMIPESIYRYDVSNGRGTFLSDLAITDETTKETVEYSAKQLLITPAENQILFVNAYDSYLYGINL